MLPVKYLTIRNMIDIYEMEIFIRFIVTQDHYLPVFFVGIYETLKLLLNRGGYKNLHTKQILHFLSHISYIIIQFNFEQKVDK